MLSSGTRIGTTRILSWLGEGSTGQSYQCESTEGDLKGNLLYVKLIHREISERNGFEDYFHQECQTLEQLEGPGIWPIKEFGVMKWKHWIGYDWLEGEKLSTESEEVSGPVIRSFAELMEYDPESLTPELLLDFMVSLHRGLYRIHQSGIAHGNVKPSNVLVRKSSGGGEAWVTEVGLFRMSKFLPVGIEESSSREVSSLNQDGRDSREEADRFRPANLDDPDFPDERWDIFALGKIVRWALSKIDGETPHWEPWYSWAEQAQEVDAQSVFASIAHSMQALPGVGEISEYGIKAEDLSGETEVDLDALREKREREWAFAEKLSLLRFRRNMTGFVGALFAVAFVFSCIYLYFLPTPWTEYSLENNSDSYQLGAGIFGGQAWGIVPANYDPEGDGGQNIVGAWTKEEGLFKMSFKKFKKTNDKEGGKKRWQFIGKGKTSPEDYHIWHDYLRFDRSKEALLLVKRVQADGTVRVPARIGDHPPSLYPKQRLRNYTVKYRPNPNEESAVRTLIYKADSAKEAEEAFFKEYPDQKKQDLPIVRKEIVKAELPFLNSDESGWSWSLFFGLGFLLGCSIYHRELIKLKAGQAESIE
jgi:hypothetical protein